VKWTYGFAESGGYDCMTDAVVVLDERNGHVVVSIDLCKYGQRAGVEATPEQRAQAESTARLIAAAPDMLAALKALYRMDFAVASNGLTVEESQAIFDQGLAAIAKAEAA
jgi:hypothetical protein